MSAFRFIFLGALVSACVCARANLVWPTESKAFARGASDTELLQTTAAGTPGSGAFGEVRNNGYKVHEGIDIKATCRDRRGEALDDVVCAMDGVVRYVNKIGGNSGYGRYVVVTHPQLDVEVYTLYAHLAEIDDSVSAGREIRAGARIGRMGRSARYAIGKAQAHLHFEIGIRTSDSFDVWYKSKKYKERNYSGNYNGMNLTGFDPMDFYRRSKAGKIGNGIASYLATIPTAFVARVYTKKVPDYARMYPALCDFGGDPRAWDIHFTWYGTIKKMERSKNPDPAAREGDVEIIKIAPSQLNRKSNRRMIISTKNGYKLTKYFKEYLRGIFI